jgi:peptide/nickel transport system ATP-binding protein/oligopeptide transport system ATP-binding protein
LVRLLDRARTTGSVVLHRFREDRVDLMGASERQMCRIRGREISMIFQEPMSSLNPVMRVNGQIAEAIRLHESLPAAAVRDRSRELLEQTGIADPARCLLSYPHQLSGGQCQRIGIAMALANKPALIIADEPTTALDVTVQAQILGCLSQLRRTNNIAILFITHDLGLVRRFADRVLVMYAGEIVESGRVAEVFARPRMPYTAALLASRPRFDAAGDPIPLEPIPGASAGISAPPSGCGFRNRCRYTRAGICDERHPDLEAVEDGHAVRCARWRGLA